MLAKWTNLKTNCIFFIFCMVLPFAIFYWAFPFVSEWTIGNDYTRFSIHHQLELMFALKTGTFPLYIPGFEGGRTAFALSIGELFHPISYLAAMFPAYWSGDALEVNTLLRLLFLGGAHFLLFHFLRQLHFSDVISFLLSFITVYSLQMLSLFRGASCESWTGFIFLMAGAGMYYLTRSKKWGLFIVFSTYWLICSGHLPTIYYILMGLTLFIFFLPFVLDSIDGHPVSGFNTKVSYFTTTAGLLLLGLLAASVFLVPTYVDFVSSCVARVGGSYAWANNYQDTFMGTVNNFFYPLRSFGAFGGTPLLLTGLLIPLLRFFKIRIPWAIWGVWALILIVFLHMQGDRTPVHYLIWKYLPFADSIRVPGRITVLMPMLFLLLFIWVFGSSYMIHIYRYKIKIYAVLSAAGILVFLIYQACQTIFPAMEKDLFLFSPAVIRVIPGWVEPFNVLLTLFILSLLVWAGIFSRKRNYMLVFICAISIVQLTVFIYYGTWIEEKSDMPTLNMLRGQKKNDLSYHFSQNPGAGLYSRLIQQQLAHTCLEPYMAKVFTEYDVEKDQENVYQRIAEGIHPNFCVIESPGHAAMPQKNSTSRMSYTGRDEVALEYGSYNRMVFEAKTSKSGFFMFAEPDNGRWKAFVNGNKAKIFRANGIYPAVVVPAGVNTVEFRYFSHATLWGLCLSLFFFFAILAYCAHRRLPKPASWIATGLILGFVVSVFLLWHHRLYNGKNLNTHYSWEKTHTTAHKNLAYYKHAQTNSTYNWHYPHLFSGGLAVDGNRNVNSGLVLDFMPITDPKLLIDLGRIEPIGLIKIFQGLYQEDGVRINPMPLYIAFSEDRQNWRHGKITGNERTIAVELPHRVNARYVMIRAAGKCLLAIDEVEIYSTH